MSTRRTDVHRPSAPDFDPENYECRGVFDLHPEDGDNLVRRVIVSQLLEEGYSFRGAPHGSHQCSHCGTPIRYAALMLHEPTGTLLYVGETCLEGRFELDKGEFRRLREAAQLNRERANKAERLATLFTEYPVLVELTYAENMPWVGGFVADVAYKMQRDGRLSERQIEAVQRAYQRDCRDETRREQWMAERAAAAAAGVRAPSGRVTVAGEVLSVKSQDSDWGVTVKMLVRADDGWKVYTTVPREMDSPARGDRVEFTATLTPKDDDPTFAIGKRPTNARVLAKA